jgi:ABC-type Zn uptake system ZnuABC Zn-binding protein ZnuA
VKSVSRRVFSIALLGILSLSGCSDRAQKVDGRAPIQFDVVCTVLPIYVIAQNVTAGVPGISLSLLISPQIGCPHDYALTPHEAALLEKADVLLMNGLGLENFLAEHPAMRRVDLRVIVATQTTDSIASWEDRAIIYPTLLSEEEAAGRHDHSMNVTNPHAWVSPFQAAKMALFIGMELGRIDTANSAFYLANAQQYAQRLDSLGQSLLEIVKRAPNRRIVTFHNAFDYFARDLGLAIVGVIESDPGIEPSARGLSDLADRIREAQVGAIFSEPQYSDRLAKMLSSETGVPVFVLDPAAGGDFDTDSYLRLMRKNLLTLEKALLFAP